jgi:hypothetical protein
MDLVTHSDGRFAELVDRFDNRICGDWLLSRQPG